MSESKHKMDVGRTAHISVDLIKAFGEVIAEHDLWDELEEHLKAKGCQSLLVSFEPLSAIGELVQRKQTEGLLRVGKPVPECACNGQFHPPPNFPQPPPDGGTDGGKPPPNKQ